MKKVFIVFLFLGCVLLTACGKFAKPTPYPDSGYPHNYPYND